MCLRADLARKEALMMERFSDLIRLTKYSSKAG